MPFLQQCKKEKWTPIITENHNQYHFKIPEILIHFPLESLFCLKLLLLLEIFHLLFWIRNNGVCSWLPSSRTNLSMFVSVLEGLHQPQGLINRSAHWEVIHGDLTQDTLGVNDEQASDLNTQTKSRMFFNKWCDPPNYRSLCIYHRNLLDHS